jgi:4-hydroxy-4-methyl-2-oxoglutarate aldolase
MKACSIALPLCAFAAAASLLSAQVVVFTKEDLIRFTKANQYERSADGRPRVPDALLEKVRGLSIEEAWGVLRTKGFVNQFEAGWQILHPERKLVGRAYTVQFMPTRPDVLDVVDAEARAKGLGRNGHQRVIDMLQENDVLVADLFGKIECGTIVGDNLAMAVWSATRQGMVIDGAIRDLEGIFPIPMSAYYRGVHPSAICNVMVTGVNVPVRIGQATVMPGDVVLGDRGGVGFIPPQFVQEIVDRAEETHIHDEWTKMKLQSGKYKSSEVYPSPSDPALKKEYEDYKNQRLKKK